MQLMEEEELYAWFQQDSATAHATDSSLMASEGMFDNKIMSWFMASTFTLSCPMQLLFRG
jgi:hypothetical protein